MARTKPILWLWIGFQANIVGARLKREGRAGEDKQSGNGHGALKTDIDLIRKTLTEF